MWERMWMLWQKLLSEASMNSNDFVKGPRTFLPRITSHFTSISPPTYFRSHKDFNTQFIVSKANPVYSMYSYYLCFLNSRRRLSVVKHYASGYWTLARFVEKHTLMWLYASFVWFTVNNQSQHNEGSLQKYCGVFLGVSELKYVEEGRLCFLPNALRCSVILQKFERMWLGGSSQWTVLVAVVWRKTWPN